LHRLVSEFFSRKWPRWFDWRLWMLTDRSLVSFDAHYGCSQRTDAAVVVIRYVFRPDFIIRKCLIYVVFLVGRRRRQWSSTAFIKHGAFLHGGSGADRNCRHRFGRSPYQALQLVFEGRVQTLKQTVASYKWVSFVLNGSAMNLQYRKLILA